MKEVVAAILVHEGRILIARRKEGDPLAHFWEFPGEKSNPARPRKNACAGRCGKSFRLKWRYRPYSVRVNTVTNMGPSGCGGFGPGG